MFKKTLLLLNLLACTLLVNSQTFTPSVISCGGGFSIISENNFSFTVGELSVKTQYTAGHIFTEGFQQGTYTLTIPPPNGIYYGPNPVRQKLHIFFNVETGGSYLAQVFNLDGKIIQTINYNNIENGADETIDFTNFLDGLYFIKITSTNGKYIKIFKIEKL